MRPGTHRPSQAVALFSSYRIVKQPGNSGYDNIELFLWVHEVNLTCVCAAEPWVTDTAACVLAHIALHKQLHPNLTDAIPAVVAALSKEIDTEEQLCDGDVTCEYVCQPAVEFLAHMASQSSNLIDIGLANGIEALARAVAVEPGKQRVTERSILALNLIASGGPSFSNAVARWRNVTNFRNQIGNPLVLLWLSWAVI